MTTPKRWQEIDRIFAEALEREPGARSEFLDEACAGDKQLRAEVESLIAHDVPESLVGVLRSRRPRACCRTRTCEGPT